MARKVGHSDDHKQNLRTVLTLLLDLAGEQSEEVWQSLAKKIGSQPCANLRQALVVRWDAKQPHHLLVTSTLRDPARWNDPAAPGETSKIGTLEAIRRCLESTNRELVHSGREVETTIESFETDQIRNSLYVLENFQLLIRIRSSAKRPIGLQKKGIEKRSNDPYWSFWLDFSSLGSVQTSDCLALVEQRWQDTWGEKTSGSRSSASRDHDSELKAKLDEWVQGNLDRWRARFEAIDDVKARRVHVELDVAIQLAGRTVDQDTAEAEPRPLRPEDLKAVIAAPGSQMLLIWEEGGAGKTSLAFRIARWGLDGLLADHPLLPVLLDPATGEGDVVERLRSQLRHLHDPELTSDFVGQLLRHRRLLPIVDHVSELSDQQRQWLSRELPPHLVLLTSRRRENSLFPAWSISELQPQRLEGEALFAFFEAYLQAKGCLAGAGGGAMSLSAEDQMHTRELLERMVGNKPITVLLVCMVIDKALDHVAERRIELLPSSVPELMLDYVERSFNNISPDNRRLADGTALRPEWIADSLKALALAAHRQNNQAYRPQNFDLPLALEALSTIPLACDKESSEEQRRDLVSYLHVNLNLLQRKGGSDRQPIYRVALDPLADYLAALALMDELNGGQPATSVDNGAYHQRVRDWLVLLDSRLEREQGDAGTLMRGFLAACRDGYRELLSRASSSLDPELKRHWEDILDVFARLAGIDPLEERRLEARHLIRRHAGDLFWSNPELLPKAIAELTAFAKEFAGGKELDQALIPLSRTMAKTTLPEQVRTAAAEALGHIGGPEAAKALIQMIKHREEPEVAMRRAAAEALGLVEAPGDDPEAHWSLLEGILAEPANHLHGDSFEAMDAKLPLLQGAARGLQRLAARKNIPTWGSEEGLKVPMLTLTATAGAVTTRVVEDVEVWQLPLPGEVPLEVVKIPDGTYTIGSPPPEVGRLAYPLVPENQREEVEALREVTLDLTSSHGAPFAMARFPITQSQWRTLAGPEHRREGDAELQSDPSQHKGGDLPVENVSWFACQEWIKRLNRWLKDERKMGPAEEPLRLALPPESLWEVACRAGSASPFHFGDTLDASWANHDASVSPYATGRPGRYLQRPSPVGAYGLVNSLGLGDLHGNVWEWCADLYHPSPCGGPHDGLPWMELLDGIPVQEQRVLLRGGSWFDGPHNCRSAYRNSNRPANLNDLVGFRVCCLPPGLPSWSFNP